MRVVHAAWLPAEAEGFGGDLILWAERIGPEPRPGAGPSHPSALGLAELRDLLAELGAPDQLLPGSAAMLLPTAEGRPLPSSAPSERAALQPWQVVGLRPELAAALEWLAAPARRARAAAPDRVAPGGGRVDAVESGGPVELGVDLGFWSLVARLGLDLLARELVVPTVERRADGDYAAAWRPVLVAPAERRRLRALVEAMPPACRAAGAPGEAVPAAELVEGFLGAAVDAWARARLAQAAWPEARWISRQGMPAGPARWLEALSSNQLGGARLAARRSSELVRDVLEWTQPALGSGSPPFRAALRLRPPQLPDEPWHLDYLLQAADDPAVLVPASRVWQEGGTVGRLAGRRVVEPQELLLADLARAARLFGPAAASLAEPWPTGAELTAQEAYVFLREAAPALADQGLAVLLPGWWTRGGARRRVGVRVGLHAGASDRAADGGFGMQALVEYDWQVALGDQLLTPGEFERLVQQKLPLIRVAGEWVELRPEDVERVLRFWRQHGDGGAITLAQALRLGAAGDEEAPPVEIADATGWLEPLLESTARLEELPEPPGFVGELRHYQRHGFAWLQFLREHRLGGCLAFDMGLGKTPTTIALLVRSRAEGPALVVCPTTVLGNWARELARFGPDLRVLVHHGPTRQADAAAFAAAGRAHDVVLTTYALLHRDEALLQSVEWATVVLDEAQNIKNPASRTSRAARRLPARQRLALTGTPVENRLGELWAIMEFLNPGYLGSAEGFRRRFSVPIERGGDQPRAEELRRLVAPLVLRRLKSDPAVIQDLPEKLELKAYLPLTREQASLYEAVVQDMLGRIGEREGVERRGLVLAALTRLKQICNHPAHFLGDGSALAGRSGKLTRLEEMLEEAISAGDHTLVFTQFAEFGGRLRLYLQERLGTEVIYLHGGTTADERDRLVERFQRPDGPFVFVLSLRAGGTGLNLTRANRVVHYDRWWNPAVESQATDRAFRIGQTRNVLVHAFICAGTLEERIDELIERKRSLAETVIGGGETWLTELSTDELRELVALRHAVIADA